jgi:hypothetical protein
MPLTGKQRGSFDTHWRAQVEHGVLGSIAVSICLVLALVMASEAMMARACIAVVGGAVLFLATRRAITGVAQRGDSL